jgi:hypothetical protein
VVDDEAGRLSEALGAQAGAVAVPGHDEQGGAGHRGDHFSLGDAAALDPLGRPAEAGGGGIKQVGGGLRG